MRMEELEVVCHEAARNLVEREPQRPLPAAVVLPLPAATRVSTLVQWPDDDGARLALLERFASEVMRPQNAPCYGFLAEAVTNAGGQGVNVVVVAYGARRNHPRVTAAPLQDGGLGEFVVSEPLDPSAFPFLAPLQRAAEDAAPPDALGG